VVLRITPADFVTPNQTKGRNGFTPEAIVVHCTDGSAAGALAWFKNPESKASAHYVINRAGDIVRVVNVLDTAWHSGRIHPRSRKFTLRHPLTSPNRWTIGIEHEALALQAWPAPMLQASAELMAVMCRRFSIVPDYATGTILPHHAINDLHVCPGMVDMIALVLRVKQIVEA